MVKKLETPMPQLFRHESKEKLKDPYPSSIEKALLYEIEQLPVKINLQTGAVSLQAA